MATVEFNCYAAYYWRGQIGGETWSAIRAAASAQSYSYGSFYALIVKYLSTGNIRQFARSFVWCHTPSLAGKTITAARLYGVRDGQNAYWLTTPAVGVYEFTPVQPITDLSNYSNFGDAIKSNSVDVPAGIHGDLAFEFNLTAGGIALINQTGTTYLGIRSLWDAGNTNPATSGSDTYATLSFIEGAVSIKLEVTYSSSPPTVTTQAVTNVSGTTAAGNGNITNIGDASVTEHGHCWNTTGTPTIADSKTTNGAAGTGAFTSALSGLTPSTKYYVRAYATNTYGTSYGNEVVFWAAVGMVYPTDPITRVTGIIIRYDRKKTQSYSMELNLGNVTTDFGLPEWSGTPRVAAPAGGSDFVTQDDLNKILSQQEWTPEIAPPMPYAPSYAEETYTEKYTRLYGQPPGYIEPWEPKPKTVLDVLSGGIGSFAGMVKDFFSGLFK